MATAFAWLACLSSLSSSCCMSLLGQEQILTSTTFLPTTWFTVFSRHFYGMIFRPYWFFWKKFQCFSKDIQMFLKNISMFFNHIPVFTKKNPKFFKNVFQKTPFKVFWIKPWPVPPRPPGWKRPSAASGWFPPHRSPDTWTSSSWWRLTSPGAAPPPGTGLTDGLTRYPPHTWRCHLGI